MTTGQSPPQEDCRSHLLCPRPALPRAWHPCPQLPGEWVFREREGPQFHSNILRTRPHPDQGHPEPRETRPAGDPNLGEATVVLPSHRDQKGSASCLRHGEGPGLLIAAQGGAGEVPEIPDFLHSFLPPSLGFREGGTSGHISPPWDLLPKTPSLRTAAPPAHTTTWTLCCMTVGSNVIPDLHRSSGGRALGSEPGTPEALVGA